jgi:hypothetical protein
MRHCSEANLLAQRDEKYDLVDKENINGDCNKLVEVSYFHMNLHNISHHMLRSTLHSFSFSAAMLGPQIFAATSASLIDTRQYLI